MWYHIMEKSTAFNHTTMKPQDSQILSSLTQKTITYYILKFYFRLHFWMLLDVINPSPGSIICKLSHKSPSSSAAISSIILKVTTLAVSLISEGHVFKDKTNNILTLTSNELPLCDTVKNQISVTIRTWQSTGEYHTSLLNVSFTLTVHLIYILLFGISLDKKPISIIINTHLRLRIWGYISCSINTFTSTTDFIIRHRLAESKRQ